MTIYEDVAAALETDTPSRPVPKSRFRSAQPSPRETLLDEVHAAIATPYEAPPKPVATPPPPPPPPSLGQRFMSAAGEVARGVSEGTGLSELPRLPENLRVLSGALGRILPTEVPSVGGVGVEGFAAPEAPTLIPSEPPSPSRPITQPLPRFMQDFGRRTVAEVTAGLQDIPSGGAKILAPESTIPERLQGVLQTAFGLPKALFAPVTAATEQAYDAAFQALPQSVREATIHLPVLGETSVSAISESIGKPLAVNLAFIALGRMQLKAADMAKMTTMREDLKAKGLIETAPRETIRQEPLIEPSGPLMPPGSEISPKSTGIPQELQDVASGAAKAFLRPSPAEGTIPTVGEQAVKGLDLKAWAMENDVGYYKSRATGAEVVFDPEQTTVSKLKQLDKQGKLPEIVGGEGTAPKPTAPTEAVTARTPEGTEVRTILTETPAQTKAAVEAQPPTTTVEVKPAAQAIPEVLAERLTGAERTTPSIKWSEMIGSGAPSALKSRAAEIDKLNIADFQAGGKFDYLRKLGLTPQSEDDRAATNMILHFENRQLNPQAVNAQTKDFGLFQMSPPTAKEVGITKGGKPAAQLVEFETKWLPRLEERIGSDDPKALALGHLNQRWTKKAVDSLQLESRPPESTVGAAQYTPSPYSPEELRTAAGPPIPEELATKVLARPGYEDLGKQVELLFRGELPNPDQRFFRNVGGALKRGDLVFPGQKDILERYGLNAEQLGNEFMKSQTEHGQALNLLSQWKKRYNAFLQNNPEIARELDVMPPPPEPVGWFKRMDNVSRALIIGRIGTAMRNLWGGLGYYSIDAFDHAVAGAVVGAREGSVAREVAASFERVSAAMRSLSPSKQKELTKVLEAFPLDKAELIQAPIQDVVFGGRVLNVIGFWNRLQENFVRRLAFDGYVKTELTRRGIAFDAAHPENIPTDIIEGGVKNGLLMTMAAGPQRGTYIGEAAQGILGAYSAVEKGLRVPIFSYINPFPRFQYANAFRFIWEHSPLGPIDLMTKGKLAQETTASGLPTLAAKAAQAELANPKTAPLAYAKAASGIGLFTAALAYRSSDNAPAKWYEINTPWGTGSGEAFAPFITYNLFAETFRAAVAATGPQWMKDMFNTDKNPPHIEPKDLARAAIGLNRIAGTGLVFVDLLQKGGLDRGWKNVSDFFGQYIGRLTVPLSSYKNLIASQNEDEAIIRDTRDAPWTGPIRKNIPIVGETLPASPSLTRSGPRTMEHPALSEIPGLSIKRYTDAEKELGRLGFDAQDILPSSGIPEADRAVATFMGPIIEHGIGALVTNPGYQQFSTHQQEAIMGEALSAIRKVANEHARTTLRPPVALELWIKRLPTHIRPLIVESPGYKALKEAIGD